MTNQIVISSSWGGGQAKCRVTTPESLFPFSLWEIYFFIFYPYVENTRYYIRYCRSEPNQAQNR